MERIIIRKWITCEICLPAFYYIVKPDSSDVMLNHVRMILILFPLVVFNISRERSEQWSPREDRSPRDEEA